MSPSGRVAVWALAAAAVAAGAAGGCGNAAARDGGAAEAGDAEAGVAGDADAAGDAGAAGDGASGCAVVEEPEPLRYPFSACDERELGYCAVWMAQFVPGSALSVDCVRGVGCVRASACANRDDPASCRCGSEPACPRYQVCWAESDASVPRCRCMAELLAGSDAGVGD